MIFEDVAEIMGKETSRRISRKTGLSRFKVERMAKGMPFNLDYNTVFALQRLGYEIEIAKISDDRTSKK